MSTIEIHDFMAKPACIGCGESLASKEYCDWCHRPYGGEPVFCTGVRRWFRTVCGLSFPHLHWHCAVCGAVFVTRTAGGQQAFDSATRLPGDAITVESERAYKGLPPTPIMIIRR